MLSLETFALLPPAALRALAADFRRTADALDARARHLDREAAAIAARLHERQELRRQLRWMESAVARGADPIVTAQDLAGDKIDRLMALWRFDAGARRRREQRAREIKIARLARQGYGDEEIAQRVGLSARHVRRCIAAGIAAHRAAFALAGTADDDQRHARDQRPPKPARQLETGQDVIERCREDV